MDNENSVWIDNAAWEASPLSEGYVCEGADCDQPAVHCLHHSDQAVSSCAFLCDCCFDTVRRFSTMERCRQCGKYPSLGERVAHPFWPWFMSRTGPGGAWQHHYCSEECASHAEEHSRREWIKRRDSDLWAIGGW